MLMVAGVFMVYQNEGASKRKSRKSAMWSRRTAILSDVKVENSPGISPSDFLLGCKEYPLPLQNLEKSLSIIGFKRRESHIVDHR